MSPRDRWRRAYGYARAGARVMRYVRDGITGETFYAYAAALIHESRAWSRLPDNARKAVQP